MKAELATLAKVLLRRRRNPKLTIALAALFVVLALIRTINSFIDAHFQTIFFVGRQCPDIGVYSMDCGSGEKYR